MHLKPAAGQPRPVGRAIVDHLFTEGEQGRIPVIGVTAFVSEAANAGSGLVQDSPKKSWVWLARMAISTNVVWRVATNGNGKRDNGC